MNLSSFKKPKFASRNCLPQRKVKCLQKVIYVLLLTLLLSTVSFAQLPDILHNNQHQILFTDGQAYYHNYSWTQTILISTGSLINGINSYIKLDDASVTFTLLCQGKKQVLQVTFTKSTTAHTLCNAPALTQTEKASTLFTAQSQDNIPILLEPRLTAVIPPDLTVTWKPVLAAQSYLVVLRDGNGNTIQEVSTNNTTLTLKDALSPLKDRNAFYHLEVLANLPNAQTSSTSENSKLVLKLLSQAELSQLYHARLHLQNLDLPEAVKSYALASLYSRYHLYLEATKLLTNTTDPEALFLLAELRLAMQEPELASDLYKQVFQNTDSVLMTRIRCAKRLAQLNTGLEAERYEREAEYLLASLKSR